MRVGVVQNCQPQLFCESGCGKSIHQFHQVGCGEHRLWTWLHPAQVQHRIVDTSFVACSGQRAQSRFARGEIESSLRSEPDELCRADELNLP